jgi:hypothetical protein
MAGGSAPERLTADEARWLLHNRGLRDETIEYFHITPNLEQQVWEFPLGKHGGTKYKAFQPGRGHKNWVAKGSKLGVYHLKPCRGQDEAWLVEGEPDVWIMHQAGLPAFSFTGGAENIPRKAVQLVARAEIGHLNIVYDNDDAGRSGALKALRALREAGVNAVVRTLPTSVGPGGDVTTLYNNLGRNDGRFRAALAALPSGPLDPMADGDDETDGDGSLQKPSQAQILVALAADADLFHTPTGQAFGTFPLREHRETHAVRGRGFREWLIRRFYEARRKPPGAQALQDALGVLEARARFDGPEHPVFIRVAQENETIYLDLCDEAWQAVEITAGGWRIVADPPVRFRRPSGMRPLPPPVAGASINELRRFLNVASDADFHLIVAYLVATLRPRGPYPILILLGEQGSAKTTTVRVVRELIDPSTALTRTAPRDERDLMIAASNAWILAFDNLSWIPPWLSDGLCRLATGGGFSTRQLYTDAEEVIFDAMRPMILNGITDMASRDDLRDRAIILNLPPIPEAARKDEETFWTEFQDARPRILGSLLDAVSAALQHFPQTKLEEQPRMADFARWVSAAELGLGWEPGQFLRDYAGNRDMAVEVFVDEDLLAAAVLDLASECEEEWVGTATDLLNDLSERVDEYLLRNKEWPKTPRALGSRLRRASPALRRTGVQIEFFTETTGDRRRLIRIGMEPDPTVSTVSNRLVDDGDDATELPAGDPDPEQDSLPALRRVDGREKVVI